MENRIYRLSKYVLKRFEENANDEGGLEILYNTKTNEYWLGNAASRYLINSINGSISLKDIFIDLSKTIFCDYTPEDVKNSFLSIIKELEEKKFIEKV